ncbi:MAG: MarR family winged helix-turn-helix transcriptional regulator [Acidimicrobiales bacterium]
MSAALTEAPTAARLRLVVTRLVKIMRRDTDVGLSPSLLSALATLEDHGALRISALAAAESVDPSVATRLVTALEERRFVERRDDPDDGRACVVALTAKGRRTLERLWVERAATLAARLARLEPRDVRAIEAALPALERLLDA